MLISFKSYIQLLSEENPYKAAEKKFLDQKADPEMVKAYLKYHKDNKNSFKDTNPELIDIDKQSDWTEFSDKMYLLSKISKYRYEFKQEKPDQITLRDDDKWLIIIPLNHKASCFYGKDTEWCTTKETKSFFKNYFFDRSQTLVYCIKKNNNLDKWAILFPSTDPKIRRHPDPGVSGVSWEEFFDVKDNRIKSFEFEKQTGLNYKEIRSIVDKNLDDIKKRREINKEKDFFIGINKDIKTADQNTNPKNKLDIQAKILAARSAEAAVQYAIRVIKGRWPAAESMIAKDSENALEYAKVIIKGRWKHAEPAIAKNPTTAYNYASSIIDGRWPEGETAIAKDARSSVKYAAFLLKGRFELGEAAIAKDPSASYEYAKEVLKGPFPKGEDAIAKDGNLSYEYAKKVLKGRFKKGENAIANSYDANAYAKEILKDPEYKTWGTRYRNSLKTKIINLFSRFRNK